MKQEATAKATTEARQGKPSSKHHKALWHPKTRPYEPPSLWPKRCAYHSGYVGEKEQSMRAISIRHGQSTGNADIPMRRSFSLGADGTQLAAEQESG